MYCIYLRKSRADMEAEARGEGETLARHKRILTELAQRRDLEIGEIYQEVVSGESLAARAEAQRMLSDVQAGMWEGVLVMEIERLARGDTIDQGIVMNTIKYSGTKIITPTKTYDPNNEFDEEYVEFSLFMSRREYKTIARRMNAGRIASVKEGNYIGSRPPYGYDKVKDDKSFTLAPNPAEADIVRSIFNWYVHGCINENGELERLGISKIARKLNDMHVPTRKGGAWVTATIRDMIKNPVYIGKIRWNWRKGVTQFKDGKKTVARPHSPEDSWLLVDGRHVPLVDEDTWNAAQSIIANNRPATVPGNREMQNPLAGLMVCGKCGRKMVRRPYNNREQPPSLICSCNACDNVSAALHLVEERIIEALAYWLKNNAIKYENAQPAATDEEQAAIDTLNAEITELEKQRKNLFGFLERGIYSEAEFRERRADIDAQIAALREDVKTLGDKIILKETYNEAIRNEVPKIRTVVETYSSLSSARAKNDMLKEVLSKVVYTRDKGGRWSGLCDNFVLDLYHKIPTPSPELLQRWDNHIQVVGTYEIAHWEMIGTMIHQCLRDATLKDIEAAGLMGYYTMHSKGVYPADPNGVPFTAAYLQCTGDPIADITEDMAADAAMSKRQHFAPKKKHCPAWQCFFLRCINLSKK